MFGARTARCNLTALQSTRLVMGYSFDADPFGLVFSVAAAVVVIAGVGHSRIQPVRAVTMLHWVGRVSLVVAALVSLFVVRSLGPVGTGVAVLLGVWLLLPYAVLAVLVEARSSPARKVADVITTLLVALGGALFLILVVFIRPDPQSGIAVVFTPVYQGIATAVLLPLTRWVFAREARAAAGGGGSGENLS